MNTRMGFATSPSPQQTLAFVASLLISFAVACSGEREPRREPDTDDASNEADDEERAEADDESEDEEVEVDKCSKDNPFCDTSRPVSPPACAKSQLIDLSPVGVNIIAAVDGSARMQAHWPRIRTVLEDLRAAHPDASFGVDLFWGQDVGLLGALGSGKLCAGAEHRVFELGQHSAKELASFLGDSPPGPASADGWELGAVVDALNYYLTNETKLADPARTNYLIFVTDGNDNCFGTPWSTGMIELLAYEKLAAELGKLNIRLIPIGFDPNAGQRDVLVATVNPVAIHEDVLEVLTKSGGSGFDKPPRVDDTNDLGAVLAQVGKRLRSCRFAIPAALDPAQAVNAFQLDFTVNGRGVERDRSRADGWDFVDGNTSQVELFGQACEALQRGAEIAASKTCSDDVCGTAAIKVETKPRFVLYLFEDSTASFNCVDGTESCFGPPGDATVQRSLSFWEAAQKALAASLVAVINDDVSFGAQFFPATDASNLFGPPNLLSCEVSSEPEVVPDHGTAIEIMRAMLGQSPFGLSPLVAALEGVAASPGRLADPENAGAVIVMSPGGDSCVDGTQADIVSRLSAAAGKLLDVGVKTYVVRHGAESTKTAEQDEQLRAIVGAGGTATSDPDDMNQTPYIEAKDEAAINDALARVSDVLSTCEIQLSGLEDGTDVDKDRANLYLNGRPILFDGRGEKADGWGWLDSERTKIELYGEDCRSFKTNRRTSIVVEFGCTPIVLL